MTHAEHVVQILSEEIARLHIELSILKAEKKLIEERSRAEPTEGNTAETVDARQASFLLEEEHD